jgi:hypothetical protein
MFYYGSSLEEEASEPAGHGRLLGQSITSEFMEGDEGKDFQQNNSMLKVARL